MSSYVIKFQVMSSGDILFATSNISYIHHIPMGYYKTFKLFSNLLTCLLTYLLTKAISRGAFAPKNMVGSILISLVQEPRYKEKKKYQKEHFC